MTEQRVGTDRKRRERSRHHRQIATAGIGQTQPAWSSQEQRSAEVLFERLHLLTHRRSNHHGLLHLADWLALLGATGWLLNAAMGGAWLLHGALLSLSSHAISHETAHRTAFRARWLNETLFWLSALLYFEEPNYRRFAHARHPG